MPDTQISEEMCLRAAVGKRKRQMERTGAGNAFDPTCPPTDNEMDDARAALEAALSGHVVVPQSALDWLFGSAPDADGNWFEPPEVKAGERKQMYWWRSKFRAMIQAAPPVPEMEG